jgi:hypothetical protein
VRLSLYCGRPRADDEGSVRHDNPLRLAGLLLLFAQLLACTMETQDVAAQASIADIVSRLHDDDPEIRKVALTDLLVAADAGLSRDDAVLALEAAAESFPPLEQEWQSASEELVRAAGMNAEPALVAAVAASFAKYPPAAKEQAFLLLSMVDSVESTDLFVQLALAEAKSPTGVSRLPTSGFEDAPRHASRLFPALLAAMERPELQWGVAYLALKYFQEAELEQGALDAEYGAIHAPLVELLQRARRLEGSDDDWLWTDEYQEIRGLAGLLLDLGGYFETDESLRDMAMGLESADPRLKYFAARSLLSVGHDVSDAALHDIAAASETRNFLFDYLDETNRRQRFPKEFRTQEAFAESEMVDWLIYPTELGRAPHEIELLRTVESKVGGDDMLYYVWKFRTHPPHWAAEDGWMVGVAGPFLARVAPSTAAYGETFSTFAKLDETDIDAYVDEIRSLVRDAREQQPD